MSRLAAAAAGGELAAQSELVRRYTARVAGFVRTLVFEPSAIEDIVQMAFVKMVRQFPALRDPAGFESWLFRIARNTAMDFLRQQRRQQALFVPADDRFEAPDQTRPLAVREILEALEIALRPLPAVDQCIVKLLIQGNSYKFIAARTGLSIIAIKGRLCRTRPKLRLVVGTATGTRRAVSRPGGALPRLPRAA